MAECTDNVIAQSGVIPYRLRNGCLEVALVTASGGPHWTIPKGHIESGYSPQDSAAKEAFEEAGLLGDVNPHRVGAYLYEKRGGMRRVRVYLMRVTRELRHWPECSRRERRWVSPEKASKMVRHDELRKCLVALSHSFSRRSLALAA